LVHISRIYKNRTLRKINLTIGKKFLQYGFILSIWIAFSSVLNISDRWIIQKNFGSNTTGIYSAGYDIIYKVIGILLSPIPIIFIPRLRELWKNNNTREFRFLINRMLIFQTCIFCIVVLFYYFLGFNTSFQEIMTRMHLLNSFNSLCIALGAFFFSMGVILQKYLEFANKQLYMIKVLFICLFINVLLNVIFVPKYNFLASSVITWISGLLYFILIFILIFRNNQFKYKNGN
jgi:O-antigen/teichoic acid export membrane protein